MSMKDSGYIENFGSLPHRVLILLSDFFAICFFRGAQEGYAVKSAMLNS